MAEKKNVAVSEMTMRDLFAGLAMAGMVANGANPAQDSTAKQAVAAADKLLAELAGENAAQPEVSQGAPPSRAPGMSGAAKALQRSLKEAKPR